MTTEENVKILREGYKLWNNSKAESVDYWMNLIADDVKWHSLADGAAGMEFTRACSCKNDVVHYFEELGKEWEMIHYTVFEFIAQSDRVVMVGNCAWKNKRTGKALETPKVDVIRMRDSKIVEFQEFYDTAKAIAATN